MHKRSLVYIGMLGGIIVIGVCAVVIYHMVFFSDVRVVFLDVGQGDAILISQGSNQILIDGGPDGTVLLEELGRYMPFWDRTIEIVVATHPDSDHIDGLIGVFENYSVDQLWYTTAAKGTATHKKLMRRVYHEEDVERIIAYHGLHASLGDASLEVVHPFSAYVNDEEDVNDTSVAMVFSVASEKFYFGGDLTSEKEDILPLESVTVLKASHHGSHSSTSEGFLQKMQPRDVIISSGENNRYGHPHDKVLERSLRAGAEVFRTDQIGSIVYTCDDMGCAR